MRAGVRSQGSGVRGQESGVRRGALFCLLSSVSCLLFALLALLPAAVAQEIQLEQEVFEISRGLRCMTCDSETAADSNAPVSVEFRRIVREQLEEGRSREEIYAFFVERYGDVVLMNPPRRGVTLIVWLAPLVFGFIAVTTLAYYLRRWTAASQAPVVGADPDYLERVRREVRLNENARLPERER